MIGIIGAGNMGRAMALRLGKKLFISDKDKKKPRYEDKNIVFLTDNINLVKLSDIIIIAVKPQVVGDLLAEIAPFVNKKLIISIVAGVGSGFIEGILGKVRVVRVMPNMPLVAGKGISAISKGRFAFSKDMDITQKIFLNFGEVVRVKEIDIDAVTAVSGSGPAYYFLFTDLLEKAGRLCGLNKKLARQLAIATFTGAAELISGKQYRSCNIGVNSKVESMQDFIKKVASKRGTTEAALKVFKDKGLDKIVKQAVKAAKDRAIQISCKSRRPYERFPSRKGEGK